MMTINGGLYTIKKCIYIVQIFSKKKLANHILQWSISFSNTNPAGQVSNGKVVVKESEWGAQRIEKENVQCRNSIRALPLGSKRRRVSGWKIVLPAWYLLESQENRWRLIWNFLEAWFGFRIELLPPMCELQLKVPSGISDRNWI